MTALTDKQAWDGSEPLNITIKAVKDEDGPGGRLIISGAYAGFCHLYCSNFHCNPDTGIGMSPDELTKNLVSRRVGYVSSLYNNDMCDIGYTREIWHNRVPSKGRKQ